MTFTELKNLIKTLLTIEMYNSSEQMVTPYRERNSDYRKLSKYKKRFLNKTYNSTKKSTQREDF